MSWFIVHAFGKMWALLFVQAYIVSVKMFNWLFIFSLIGVSFKKIRLLMLLFIFFSTWSWIWWGMRKNEQANLLLLVFLPTAPTSTLVLIMRYASVVKLETLFRLFFYSLFDWIARTQEQVNFYVLLLPFYGKSLPPSFIYT